MKTLAALLSSRIRRVARPRRRLALEPLERRELLAVELVSITQTAGAANGFPALNGDGQRIAFPSSANLTGANADGNEEIFLLDRATHAFTQITHTLGRTNTAPALSGEGAHVAFLSDRNHTRGEPGGGLDPFLIDLATGEFRALAQTRGGVIHPPSISDDGQRVVFASNANPTGQNPDGNFEIFLFDAPSGALTQATQTVAATSLNPKVSGDGAWIVFDSDANLTGENEDENSEIFVLHIASGAFTQITRTGGSEVDPLDPAPINANPSISRDGGRIAFESDAEALEVSGETVTFDNADRSFEVFLFDVASNTFTQATRTTGGDIFDARLSADGSRIGFISRANLGGGNPGGNDEVYLFDVAAKALHPITQAPVGHSAAPSLSGDGTWIAFRSSADLTGDNPEGNLEVFLARFTPDRPWQNPDNRYDVLPDGAVNLFDLLELVARLRAQAAPALPPPSATFRPPPYLDVNGDGLCTLFDLIDVVQFLREQLAATPEAEPAPGAPGPIPTIPLFSRNMDSPGTWESDSDEWDLTLAGIAIDVLRRGVGLDAS